MYFYYRKGKRYLDLRGDIVLTANHQLITCDVRSAVPRLRHVRHACVNDLTAWQKVKTIYQLARFVLRPPKPLDREQIKREGL